ncbi:MAG: hypothetical protein KF813_09125 [Trueperaceae bacterium]|nr:hypothetical protein [Trueperaceae bacterium]
MLYSVANPQPRTIEYFVRHSEVSQRTKTDLHSVGSLETRELPWTVFRDFLNVSVFEQKRDWRPVSVRLHPASFEVDAAEPWSGQEVDVRILTVSKPKASLINRPSAYSALFRDFVSSPAIQTSVLTVREVSDKYRTMLDEIRAMQNLQHGWNTYDAEAPNQTAVELASKMLVKIWSFSSYLDRVLPTASGGIALIFVKTSGYADIEAFNDGEVLVGAYPDDGDTEVWPVDPERPDAGLRRLRVWLED